VIGISTRIITDGNPDYVNIQAPGLGVAVGDRGYVLVAGGVLPGWVIVVSGMISGCD
jgi:hypothetical protein